MVFLPSEDHTGPVSKRARHLASWEALLINGIKSRDKHVGLAELFGDTDASNTVVSHQENTGNTGNRRPQPQHRVREQHRFLGSPSRDGFFTLRMEHREGGAVARYRGEERILLFRSDRAGAIAKIIFSSTPAPKALSKAENRVSTHQPEEGRQDESELVQMSQAKIHVLDVKEQYRGRDLGGLLFSEAVAVLRHRYGLTEDAETASSFSSSVRCQLDAEEDVRRHNKLVGFYEKLGCSIKPKAKFQYLNNNDGETYRKVPMQIALRAQHLNKECQKKGHMFCEGFEGRRGGFLPVKLLGSEGARVGISSGHQKPNEPIRRVDWLVVDDGEGNIQFRTTQGHRLLAEPDGRCIAVLESEYGNEEESCCTPIKPSSLPDWSIFHLHRVSDAGHQSYGHSESDGGSRRNELWMLLSSHGTFLRTDSVTHTLLCSKDPAFWQANNDDLCLTCTSDTPPRRQHYRKTWVKQTVEYVTAMRERYLGFKLKTMRLRDALDLVKNIPCNPFLVDRNDTHSGPSVRTLCFRTAEAARNAGHSDWVQLVALVHELGVVVNRIVAAAASSEDDDFDWTLSCRSRVVGCAAPGRASFGEFRHLNSDEADDRYNSPQGIYEAHCGLSKVLLTWTGPEYMYNMLRHNSVMIPEEGLAMLRFFSLGDWHTHLEYKQLTNGDDEGLRPFVMEFDRLRRCVRQECMDAPEMTDADCDKLWAEHYSNLVSKYDADGELQW